MKYRQSFSTKVAQVFVSILSLAIALAPLSFAQQPQTRILVPEDSKPAQPNKQQSGQSGPRAQKPQLVLQTGVTEPAGAIAFSPDGQFLASMGALGLTVKLWEVATGRELAAFSAKSPGNLSAMGTALTFGADGKSLLAYSGGVLSQWDARTGQQLRRLKLSGDGAGQFNAVFSPDARWLAINSTEKKTLTVNDVSSGKQIQSFVYSDPADGRDEMPAMAFSPDGSTLAVCVISEDNRARKSVQLIARDVSSWQVTKTIKVTEKDTSKDNEKAMRDLAKNPKAILGGSAQLSGMSFRNAEPYRALRFSSDGRTLAMLTRDLITESGMAANYSQFAGEVSVRFFDVAAGRELNNVSVAAEARNQYRELSVSADTTFALSADGRQFVAAGNDSSVKLADSTGRVLTTLTGHSGEVMAVAFSGDGKLVASSGVDSTIRIWNVANASTGQADPVRTLGASAAPITGAAFSEDGRALSIAGSQSVSVWDLPNGTALRTISLSGTTPRDRSELREVSPASFTADGKMFVAKDSRAVKVWETRTGREVRSFPITDGQKLSGLAVNREGSAVAMLENSNPFGRKDDAAASPVAPQAGTIQPTGFPAGAILMPGASGNKRPDKKQMEQMQKQAEAMEKQAKAAEEAMKRGETGKAMEMLGQMMQSNPQIAAMMPGGAAGLGSMMPQSNVSVKNVGTGQQISSVKFQSMLAAAGGGATAFSADGRTLAFAPGGHQIKLNEVASGRELATISNDRAMMALGIALSPDGRTLASGFMETAPGANLTDLNFSNAFTFNLRLWDVSQPQPRELRSLPLKDWSNVYAFSPDGRIIVTGGMDVKLWEVASGREVLSLAGHTLPVNALSFSPDGKLLVTGCEDGGSRLWDSQTGELLVTMVSLNKGADWLAVTPDGLFDGTPAAWNQILWRFSATLTDVTPVEVYFNEFFYPALLADIFAGKRPRAEQDVAQKDRRQPAVKLSLADGQAASISNRTIKVRVEVAEPAAGNSASAGARDVRLFRNGTLIKVWRGDVLKGQPQVALEASLPIVAGENRLTAYAFNRDNVKSSDAVLTVTGAGSLRRKGVAYVLACGINRYSNDQYNLKYAVADATSFADEVRAQQMKLGNYERVEIIPLLDAEATKANILLALQRLAGGANSPSPSAPASLAKIQPAQPEDAVIVYFAGHGTAQGARFFLVPHDLGYTGSRTALTAGAMLTILTRSISDLELESAVEGLDAAQLVMVIDACNSGQALEAEEKRRGPMNSKGLAQLAYEKGMYILTAAQSYQVALEAAQLGHGYLTYALVEDGLKKGSADRDAKDGQVLVREWFNFAAERVPQMQEQENKTRILLEEEKAADSKKRGAQRPRVFYRREAESRPMIVAKP